MTFYQCHSGARVKRANPESRDSPMRNCASEVWSGACHRAALARTRWDHPGMTKALLTIFGQDLVAGLADPRAMLLQAGQHDRIAVIHVSAAKA